jgi:hypothetical protein
MTPSVRISTTRVIDAQSDAIRRILEDPSSYPDWVEALQRFEPQEDGTYVGEVGYLGRRKVRVLRQTAEGPQRYAWASVDDRSRIGWEVTVEQAAEPDKTRVSFVWEKEGSGSIFGASANSPILKAALETVAERSLNHLAAQSAGLALSEAG